MFDRVLQFVKRILPKKLFAFLQPPYHYLLAIAGALVYRFPSRNIKVVGVTGTKGKSTTVELVNALLEEAGYTTSVLSTIHFKIARDDRRNLYKMTMPGRFFVQKFLHEAVRAKCDWVVLEMTSEGVKQFRHKFISLDALIFTNLSPEHIESHGSFEKYRDAKRSLGHLLEKSNKRDTIIIANADEEEGAWYLGLHTKRSFPYSLDKARPYEETHSGMTWTFKDELITSHLFGIFNLYNQLAAATFAASQDIPSAMIKKGLEKFSGVRGRVEFVQKEPFAVVVDYAHTTDSLEKFYCVFANKRNICVLGNTGGGRDAWKRPEMAHIAVKNCHHIILTNEDPYDEDPQKILDEMAACIVDKSKFEIILDRRKAIRAALRLGQKLVQDGEKHVNVLLTGKGTDPYIMGAHGSKEPWDDATVVREEIKKLAGRA